MKIEAYCFPDAVEDRGRDVMIDGLKLARDAGIDVHLTLIGAHPPEKRWPAPV